MRTVIIPQETKETISLHYAQEQPIFIKSTKTGKLIGMLTFHRAPEDYKENPKDLKHGWKASNGYGGLVGYHRTIEECIHQFMAGNDKYELVVDVEPK